MISISEGAKRQVSCFIPKSGAPTTNRDNLHPVQGYLAATPRTADRMEAQQR
jgi:hypothetical protein